VAFVPGPFSPDDLQDSTSIFTNDADVTPNANDSFHDAASTALLASTVYRIALLSNDYSHLAYAEKSRKALFATSNSTNSSSSSDSSFMSMAHFTSDGWLTPVVNPLNPGVEGAKSPEGQAFVLELQAAWRDWVADGSKAHAGAVVRMQVRMWGVGLGIVLGILLLL
jgi:hypothetical protein